MATPGWRTRNHSDENLQSWHPKSNLSRQQLYQFRNQADFPRHPSSQRNQSRTSKNRSGFKDNWYQKPENVRGNQNHNQNRDNPQWQNLSLYDRRSFVLRSKDFRRFLVQTLDQILTRVDTWYPDEVLTNDDMDWQPEIEVVIPQMEDTIYTYGPLGSSASGYSDQKEEIKMGFTGAWRNSGVAEDGKQQGEFENHEGENWTVPRSGGGDCKPTNFLLHSTRPYHNEEEEIG